MSDEAYHFPPDLLEQLVNTIPLLCRSKQNVLDFFRGCGVAHATLADFQQKVANDRASINKYQIVRVTLSRLNEAGDQAELLLVLEEQSANLRKWLGAKLLAASVYREPLTRPGLDAMASA